MKRSILLLAALFLTVAACGASSDVADTSASPNTTIATGDTVPTAEAPAGDEALAARPTGTDAKLESNLYQAVLLAESGLAPEEVANRAPVLRFDETEVLIEVTLDEMTEDAVAAVSAAGMTISDEFPDLRLLTGSAEISSLLDLAALPAVDSVVPQFGAATG